MSLIRTPPTKHRQTRTRAALQSTDVPRAPILSPNEAGTGIFGNETESEDNEVPVNAASIVSKKSDPHIATSSGESGTSFSSPSDTVTEKTVGKLDSNVFKPFGSVGNISMSRSSSDTSETASDAATCRGGPNNPICGIQVVNGDRAIQCDKCQFWFHAKCQAIPKPAHDALVRYKCLSWLCEKCKKSLGDGAKAETCPKTNQVDLPLLERKLQVIGDAVRDHMKIIVQSVKEQEKVVADSAKLVENICKDQNAQKTTYADMVRGSCDKMVKEVNAKIETIPGRASAKDTLDAGRAMSNVFDSFLDKEKRKLNVVVHNLPEDTSPSLTERSERDNELFRDIVKEGLSLIIRPTRSFRVGKRSADKPRLLIVSLENMETKVELLRMASQLRHLSTWKRIYVTPDLTKKEREESKKLREELAKRRQAGETDIMIKRGRIVKLSHLRHLLGSIDRTKCLRLAMAECK